MFLFFRLLFNLLFYKKETKEGDVMELRDILDALKTKKPMIDKQDSLDEMIKKLDKKTINK